MNDSNNTRQLSGPHEDTDDSPKKIPYRRDRTPSIVVQSLGLTFHKDSAITGSIELADSGDEANNDDDDNLNDNSTSPTKDEAPDSTTSGSGGGGGGDDHLEQNEHGTFDSTGSSSSPQNNASSSPSTLSPIKSLASAKSQQRQQMFNAKPELGATSNRRLSLNFVSNAPRRQSLTVEGLSSASFINPSGNATGSLRNKVALKPGHSLMGWIQLAANPAIDISGMNGKYMDVTPEELSKHNTEEDCWVALKGNVYNVTKYLSYHPGGAEELMRGAGRDATELFNEVHRWVNYESILAKALIGPYKIESPLTPKGRSMFKTITEDNTVSGAGRREMNETNNSNNNNTNSSSINNRPAWKDPTVAQRPNRRQSIALTVPSPNKYQSLLLNTNSNTNLNAVQQPPTYVIMQDKSCIKLRVQDLTTLVSIRSRHLICDLTDQMDLHISVILSYDWLYRVHLHLDQTVDRKLVTSLSNEEKTITVQLNKKEQSIWNKIGTSLDLNDSLCEMTLADKFFRPTQLVNKTKLTHDTYLFEFKLNNTLMYVPISWHVLIREHIPEADLAKRSQQQQSESASASNRFEDTRIYKNYTPVVPSLTNEQQYNDGLIDESGFMPSLYFIIKIYQDGVVTSKLDQLNVGDMVDVSDYQSVDFDIETLVDSPKKHWVLLAAGTGITPFCRTIQYLLTHGEDNIETITLVFFNKTQKDIIWRDQFESLAAMHENKFRFINVLSDELESGSPIWTGKRGRVSQELVAEFVDSRSPDELQILACGPRGFTQAIRKIAADLNLTEKLYVFHG